MKLIKNSQKMKKDLQSFSMIALDTLKKTEKTIGSEQMKKRLLKVKRFI